VTGARASALLAAGLLFAGYAAPAASDVPVATWVVDDSTKILPSLDLGAPRKKVTLEGAGGETVAFQLVLESRVDRAPVEVKIRPLESGEASIGAERFELFLEAFLDCPPVDKKMVTLGPGPYPDPLVPLWEKGPGSRPIAHPLRLKAGTRTVLWIDLSIPRAAAPGVYRGGLSLAPAGEQPVEVEVELSRYGFDLPRRQSLSAWVPLYAARLVRREKVEAVFPSERGFALVRRYMKMANDHRFVTQLMDYQPRTRFERSTGALESIDWTDYDRLNGPALDGSLFRDGEPPRLWKVGGFVYWGARPGDPPHFGGTKHDRKVTSAHRRALSEYAAAIRKHFDEKGFVGPELFFYMIDEPDAKAQPHVGELIRSYGNAIHAAGSGIRHLVTVAPGDFRAARGGVDIWAVWGAGYVPSEMRARQALGERAWFYQKSEPFVGGHLLNSDGLGLRSWPWIAKRYGVDGIFLWVGNFWNENPYRDPVNWNDDQLGNGVLFYPGAMLPSIGYPAIEGPVSSVRMKTLRRGLFDYEYFELLKASGGDPEPLVSGILRSALNEEGWNPIWKHPRWARHGDWSHDPAEWDGAVRAAALEISRRLSE
jgi:hypothetical protein